MRTLLSRGRALIALAVAGVLVFAGVAIAKHVAASVDTVSATFIATTVSDRWTKTCTGADGTYEVTHANYTGTATSADARLNGNIALHVHSVYNTNENLGWVSARVRVWDGDDRPKAKGHLRAVNVNGQLEGLLSGHVRGPHGKLLGNVSAAYTSAGGFTTGALGSGSTANTAIVHAGRCPGPNPAAAAARADKIQAAKAAKEARDARKKDRKHR
jgi:hypothetical protein